MNDSLAAFAAGRLTDAPVWKTLSHQGPLNLPLTGADESISAVTRGLLGLIHFELNQAFPSWDDRAAELTDHLMLQPALGELVTSFTVGLRARQAAIQGALAQDRADPRVHEAIGLLVDFALSRASRFARVQAAAHRAVTAQRGAKATASWSAGSI
jgi:hypothetical protein